MNKLSIRTRLTLWFCLWMALIGTIVLVLLFHVGEIYVKNQSRTMLINGIEEIIEKVEASNGRLKIEDQPYFIDGLYLSVYNEEGYFLYGQVPKSFNNDVYFVDGQFRTFYNANNSTWHLYDVTHFVEGYGNIWVRGVTSSAQFETAVHTMLSMSVYIIPSLLLLAIIGGYIIITRALKPVKQLTKTTQLIQGGKDLSKRINLGNGKDEIYVLASTIDEMFNRLQHAFENEKQFTSDASHELRTPIAVIISQCEYALENAKTKKEYQEALETVLEHTKKMSLLVNQLLTFSRINQQNYKIEYERINLSELVEMSLLPYTEESNEKNVKIEANVAEGIMLEADQLLLMRMVDNLVSNSVKYGIENGSTFVTLTEVDEKVILTFKDNGIGIGKEHIDKIFNRFYQVDTSRNEGLGLGLAMVKWIVSMHNGEIMAESEEGIGCKFVIIFNK